MVKKVSQYFQGNISCGAVVTIDVYEVLEFRCLIPYVIIFAYGFIKHGAVNRGSVRHLSWRTRIGTLEDNYRIYAKGHRFDFLFFVRATIEKRAGSPLMEFRYGTVSYGTVALRLVCMWVWLMLQVMEFLFSAFICADKMAPKKT
jgi:hypothetical protein